MLRDIIATGVVAPRKEGSDQMPGNTTIRLPVFFIMGVSHLADEVEDQLDGIEQKLDRLLEGNP